MNVSAVRLLIVGGTLVVGFLSGYTVRNIGNEDDSRTQIYSDAPFSSQEYALAEIQCRSLDSSVNSLGELYVEFSKFLGSIKETVALAENNKVVCLQDTSKCPTNAVDSHVSNMLDFPESRDDQQSSLGVNEIQEIQQESLSAFVNGEHIRTVLGSKKFQNLPQDDQHIIIDQMVDMINNGQISESQISSFSSR